MLLSYLFHGWCYFKAGSEEITMREKARERKRSKKREEKALQCDLISCLQQMTLFSDMFPVMASISQLDLYLGLSSSIKHHTHSHTRQKKREIKKREGSF